MRSRAFLIATAFFITSCGSNDNRSTSKVGAEGSAAPADGTLGGSTIAGSNTQDASKTPVNQSFFDPAWAGSLGEFSNQNDVDQIRRIMFMAKGNQPLQNFEQFKFFVTALYSCDEARKAGQSEFDKDRIFNAAMQRLKTYLATQPDTFVWENTDAELGTWNASTHGFSWSSFDNVKFIASGPQSDPSIPCGGAMPLASSRQEPTVIRFEFANEKEIEARLPPVRMDEKTAREFVQTHPDRKIIKRYTWVSRPQTPGYTFVSPGDKIFRPVVSKVEILDPITGGVLSSIAI